MTKFGFSDLHSFKDYVGFVRLCCPDQFPSDERIDGEPWSIDLAFEGLRLGLSMAIEEKGKVPKLETFGFLMEEAYPLYKAGKMRDAYLKLQEAEMILKKFRSQ